MVRLCIAGGGLIDQELFEAARIHQSGDVKNALLLYRAILEKAPHEPRALMMIGVIAQQLSNSKTALDFLDAALKADPLFSEAWFNRSIVLRALKRETEALSAAQQALALNPKLGVAYDLAAQILTEQRSLDEAENAYQKALALDPTNANFHNHLASLLMVKGDLSNAYKAAATALSLDPSLPQIILGNVLKAMGHPDKAIDCFAHTRKLYPALGEATTNQAMACLQMGDTVKGWDLWEKRLDMRPDLKNIPFWQGETTSHLLLYEDQGIGDTFHFVRFIPCVEKIAERLTLQVPAHLKHLIQESFPSLSVEDEKKHDASYSARCRLSSLAFHFQDKGYFSDKVYLKTKPSYRLQYQTLLKKEQSPHIGFVWAGNPLFRGDALRSLPLSTLEPFLKAAEGHLVSLQKDRPLTENYPLAASVLDLAPELSDFAKTAALIDELDLVVTVDTAIAHLAGTLHKPVFILLPFDCDWRWFLGRSDSPWYPTAKLFRQSKPGIWKDAIDRMTSDVQKFLSGDRSALKTSETLTENLHKNPDALPLPHF